MEIELFEGFIKLTSKETEKPIGLEARGRFFCFQNLFNDQQVIVMEGGMILVAQVLVLDLEGLPYYSLGSAIVTMLEETGGDFSGLKDQNVAVRASLGYRETSPPLLDGWCEATLSWLRGLGSKPFVTDSSLFFSDGMAQLAATVSSKAWSGYPLFAAGGAMGNETMNMGAPEEIRPVALTTSQAKGIVTLNTMETDPLVGFRGATWSLLPLGGRMVQESLYGTTKGWVKYGSCDGCGICLRSCSRGAVSLLTGANFCAFFEKASIEPERCNGCLACWYACPLDAINVDLSPSTEDLLEDMLLSAKAVLKNKKDHSVFFVLVGKAPLEKRSLRPYWRQAPFIKLMASRDPLALDRACLDAVLEWEPRWSWKGSLENFLKKGEALGLGHAGYLLKKF